MATNLSRLLNNRLQDAARKRVTKNKTFKQARTELIRAIAKADGTPTSTTYMVLRGGAMCPMRKCLSAFAQVLPNVGMGSIMAATKKDGCVYRRNGYGFKPRSKKNSLSN